MQKFGVIMEHFFPKAFLPQVSNQPGYDHGVCIASSALLLFKQLPCYCQLCVHIISESFI